MQKPLNDYLLISDIDGTLVDTQKKIPRRNLEAIRRFQELGGRFTIATGRSARSAAQVANLVGVNCPLVTNNGTILYDMEKGQVVRQRFLPDSFPDIIRRVAADFPHIGIQAYLDADIYMVVHNPVVEYQVTVEEIPFIEASPHSLPPKANKLLFGGSHEELTVLRTALETYGLDSMYGLFTEDQYFELLPQGVHKGSGAQVLAGYCGVSSGHVAAVGDYYNDVEMLKSVPLPAVAANAPDEVKQYAVYVACHCDDGAVADVLERLEKWASGEIREFGNRGREQEIS
ncbi:MAG: Cof-type HAD-IIB family hydrolase [Clostridiales bacterium]|nr:Cof-type HAD-IIB family hydrolase [Clostridiales bacterium]